jgi:MFS superfamily sulfate permease-like transporter
MRAAFTVTKEGKKRVITFKKDVSFLNKATLINVLKRIPEGSSVVIDGTKAELIDHDIIEVIEDFQLSGAIRRIHVEVRDIATKDTALVPPQPVRATLASRDEARAES